VLLMMLVGTANGVQAELKPAEMLRKHLDSIGTEKVRAGAKSRVVEGSTKYKLIVGGSGEIRGNAVMVSEGRNLQMLLKINAQKYHGEKFMRNGDRTFVAGTYDDKSRSEFGTFLRSEDYPLREGLLGGVWSAGWALLDIDAALDKLKYQGQKKVEGRQLEVFQYKGKKNADMDVALYFEPDTFRHVMTIYKVSIHAGIGASNVDAAPSDNGSLNSGPEIASARQQQTRYRIEERFSDFKESDGLTLPSHYDLRFQEELQNGFTKMVDWDITQTRILNNVNLDPKNFEIH
jgi:hypothetical protein